MNPNEPISLHELLDEFWSLWFSIVKGVLLSVTRLAHWIAMLLFYVAQRFYSATTVSKSYVEEWEPVRPIVFEFRRD